MTGPGFTAGAKWRAIALLALCEILAMALWFAAAAIPPALRAGGREE